MIKNIYHCLICEHNKRDSLSGVYCGVTEQKPKFAEKCTIKEFGETMNQKIVELDSDLTLIKVRKAGVILHLYTFLGIALIVLVSDYFLSTYLWETGWVTSLSIAALAIGLGLIPYAVNPLNKFKSQLKIAKNSVNELKAILNIYNIKYEIETTLHKGSHDIIDIENTLVLIKNGKKEPAIKYNKSNAKVTIDY